MAWQHLHPESVVFVVAACILLAWSSPISVSSAEPAAEVCDQTKPTIHLELSRKTPAVKFNCGGETDNLHPPMQTQQSESCYTDESCTKTGSLSAILKGNAYIEYGEGGYTLKSTGFPEADTTVYFRCSNNSANAAKNCTVAVTVKGSPPLGKLSVCLQPRSAWRVGLCWARGMLL